MDQKGNGRKKGKQANEADGQNSRVSELFPEVALVDRDVRMATGLGKSWAKSGSLVEKKGGLSHGKQAIWWMWERWIFEKVNPK